MMRHAFNLAIAAPTFALLVAFAMEGQQGRGAMRIAERECVKAAATFLSTTRLVSVTRLAGSMMTVARMRAPFAELVKMNQLQRNVRSGSPILAVAYRKAT